MSRHKTYSLSPRDCLKTCLFQKWQRMVAPPGIHTHTHAHTVCHTHCHSAIVYIICMLYASGIFIYRTHPVYSSALGREHYEWGEILLTDLQSVLGRSGAQSGCIVGIYRGRVSSQCSVMRSSLQAVRNECETWIWLACTHPDFTRLTGTRVHEARAFLLFNQLVDKVFISFHF